MKLEDAATPLDGLLMALEISNAHVNMLVYNSDERLVAMSISARIRDVIDGRPLPQEGKQLGGECICPKCGLRHGNSNPASGEF